MMGKMQRFRQALRGLDRKILAIDEVFGADTIALVTKLVKGEITCDSQLHDHFGMNAEAVRDRAEKYAAPTIIPAGPGKAVALVSVRGVALYDFEFQPYCFSTMLLAQTLKGLANDPEIGTIVLDIDSPGGMVTGTPEAADALFAAKKKKNCIALVNPLCASAAYWIASQATEITAIPSADVGSVGVFMMHIDMSGMMEMYGIKPTFIYAGKYKIEGNPYEPLGDEAKAHYQGEVDATYQDFVGAIARGRGIDVAAVEKKFGQGRTMSPQDAKRAGMIDKVATVDVVMRACGMQEMEHESRRRRGEAADTSQEAHVVEENAADEKKSSSVIIESTEDCESIQIRREENDGKVAYYTLGEWPPKIIISAGLVQSSRGTGVQFGKDCVIFTMANGFAFYDKVGETTRGDWICVLQKGTHEYAEAPALISPNATSDEDRIEPVHDAPAEDTPQESSEKSDDAEKHNASDARRRRLELLSA